MTLQVLKSAKREPQLATLRLFLLLHVNKTSFISTFPSSPNPEAGKMDFLQVWMMIKIASSVVTDFF